MRINDRCRFFWWYFDLLCKKVLSFFLRFHVPGKLELFRNRQFELLKLYYFWFLLTSKQSESQPGAIANVLIVFHATLQILMVSDYFPSNCFPTNLKALSPAAFCYLISSFSAVDSSRSRRIFQRRVNIKNLAYLYFVNRLSSPYCRL